MTRPQRPLTQPQRALLRALVVYESSPGWAHPPRWYPLPGAQIRTAHGLWRRGLVVLGTSEPPVARLTALGLDVAVAVPS